MIRKVAHFADYHVHNDKWHDRYDIGNDFIFKKLEQEKPDRIVLEGDLYENFILISNEAEVFAGKFLNRLSEIAPIIITLGNHDLAKKSKNKLNSVNSLITLINNPRITLFEKSGFFDDENVVWVNHSHLEKNINPWNDETHIKDKNKIYIDLWHDPINGCLASNGIEMTSKSYRNISDFKGDFGFFGDIHKFQYLNSEKTYAYPSSTYQQTMGEDVETHGFLLWDIQTKKSEFIIVPDEYKLITFKTYENFDYDNITFDHPLATKKSQFRIVWKDYSSNMNNENLEKLKSHITNKWNSDITILKERIYTNISSSQKLTESINLNDKTTQQDIFKEYLIANKYDDAFINEILKIDNIIDEKLELSQTINNVEWSICRLWGENFKSYDRLDLDWENTSGIIQLNGSNRNGKSTILDLITYVTHGTTLSTNKLGGAQRVKHSDNQYINNKRDLDFCNGGMLIDVNGIKYTLVRQTDRKWSSNKKSITSVSTNIEYYEGVEICEENKLRGERKTDTQKMLDSIIGDFEDFIRLTLTNSENLNYLISLDRATFIDSVIKDAGYDIFEKKLEAFKKYKADESVHKIDMNVKESEQKVFDLEELLVTYKNENIEHKKEIDDIDLKLKIVNDDRDVEIKKLHKIDTELAKIDIESATLKIEEYKKAIESNLSQQIINSEKIKGLKKEYDAVKYESLLKAIKTIDDDVLNLKLKISQEEAKIEKENNNISRVDEKIVQLKEKEIQLRKTELININNDIENMKKEFSTAVSDKKRNISDKLKDQEFEEKTLSVELLRIKEKGDETRKAIKEMDSEYCPLCGQKNDEKHQKHIDDKVAELNTEISNLLTKWNTTKASSTEAKRLIELYKSEIADIDALKFPNDIIVIQNDIKSRLAIKKSEITAINDICLEIENNNYANCPELEKNINIGLKIKIESLAEIPKINETIDNIKKNIRDKGFEKDKYQSDIYILEQDKNEVKTHDLLVQNNTELSLKIDNIKLTIENAKIKIDRYYDQLKFVQENKIIEERIKEFDSNISEHNDLKESINKKISLVSTQSTLTESEINNINHNLKKFAEQIKKDELLKEYGKIIHRDGLPSYLLMKSKDLINCELEDLLVNVDFNVFFDDNLDLVLYDKKTPAILQRLLTCSGAERSFGAVALKMALRTINTKSRPSILLLDEVMLKFKNEMVTKFNEMLLSLKNKVDKIIIIEHVHPVDYDVLIEVEKNADGISSLNVF